MHSTRKSCGSLLAALDVHSRVAVQILRHSKIAITMEIYTEAVSAATRDALRKLGERLGPPAQVLALAAAMPRRYSLLVLPGAGAGLRQGEAFGLAASQVDAVAGMITVSQQVIVADRHPVLAPPKTSASVRDVPMPGFLQDAIARHVSDLALTDGVLCLTPKRTLLRRVYYNREIWKPALAAAGLPADTTFHDLRHTFASTALAEGVPISEVSRWLGHKSITTTVDLYGHLVPEASGRARDALDRAFGPAAMCPQSAPATL